MPFPYEFHPKIKLKYSFPLSARLAFCVSPFFLRKMDLLFRFIVWFSYLHAAQKDIFIIFITPKARMQTGAWYIGWTWAHSVRSGWLLWTLRLIQTMEKVMQGRSTAARVCGGIRNLWRAGKEHHCRYFCGDFMECAAYPMEKLLFLPNKTACP